MILVYNFVKHGNRINPSQIKNKQMNLRNFLVIVVQISILLLQEGNLYAQKQLLNQAEKMVASGNYHDAIALYSNIKKMDKQAFFYRGISHFYTNNPKACINDMLMAYQKKLKNPDLFFYTAESFFMLADYAEAAVYYKNYLKNVSDTDAKRKNVIDKIAICETGLKLKYKEPIAFVENLGPNVNTVYNESNPIIDPVNRNFLYFSSDRDISTGGKRNEAGLKDDITGRYYMDMYAIEMKEGNWSPVYPFNSLQNSSRHEIIQDFGKEGKVLYFIKSNDLVSGTLYADSITVGKAFLNRLESPIIAEKGDKDLFVFNDQYYFFASKRIGGFGGYDIYVTYKINDFWIEPINLGPKINTAYDEVSPFLSDGGAELFFSSNRPEGMGGFDIYQISFGFESGSWTTEENLGPPINSPANDLYFRLSEDGAQAYFASDRLESVGLYDLYVAYLKSAVEDQEIVSEVPVFMEMKDSLPTTTVVKESIPARTLIMRSLYYTSDEDVLSTENKSILNVIVEILNIYPQLNIRICGNTSPDGDLDLSLFFTMKRVEMVRDHLVAAGIKPQRIVLESLGSVFPIEKDDFLKNPGVRRFNNRIDLEFFGPDIVKLEIIKEIINVPAESGDSLFDVYENSSKGISFRIKLAETTQVLRSAKLSKCNKPTMIKTHQSNYYYLCGIFEDYHSARAAKNDLLRSGVIDAKIIPFYKNNMLPIDEIEILKNEFPELREYLKYESN